MVDMEEVEVELTVAVCACLCGGRQAWCVAAWAGRAVAGSHRRTGEQEEGADDEPRVQQTEEDLIFLLIFSS